MQTTIKKPYAAIAATSALLYLCACQFNRLSLYHGAYVVSVSFFVFTWCCAYRCQRKDVPVTGVLYAIIGGFVSLDFIDRLTDISASMNSLPLPFICLFSSIAAFVCFRKQTPLFYSWAAITIIIINSYIYPYWVLR